MYVFQLYFIKLTKIMKENHLILYYPGFFSYCNFFVNKRFILFSSFYYTLRLIWFYQLSRYIFLLSPWGDTLLFSLFLKDAPTLVPPTLRPELFDLCLLAIEFLIDFMFSRFLRVDEFLIWPISLLVLTIFSLCLWRADIGAEICFVG